MCFIKDNTNFIHQKIIVAMNGLSEEECLKNYDLIKEDTRRRLKQSYLSCNDKSIFYKDAFSTLSFYETDYLMANLLFENDKTILMHLTNDENFYRKLNFKIEDSYSKKYLDFYKMNDNDFELIKNILKDETLFNLSNDELNEKDIVLEKTIVNKLSYFFVENSNTENFILLYFIFIKYLRLKKSTDLSIITLLYAKINLIFNVELFNNFQLLQNKISNLFYFEEEIYDYSNPQFLPLFTNLNTENKGLLSQKENFKKNLLNYKIVFDSILNKNFTPILNLLEDEVDDKKIDQYIDVLNQKINNLEIPDYNEMNNFNRISNKTPILKQKLANIKKRLYQY